LPQTIERLAADPEIRRRTVKLREMTQRTGRF
jgi:hypothetical protein